VLSYLRRKPLPQIETAPATPASAGRSCALAACAVGSTATVVSVACGEDEACRLRALGLCEGASISVVDARQSMFDVRGTRLALGRAITAGITVRPLES
jgi:Fe2+ transport system protein FeoA